MPDYHAGTPLEGSGCETVTRICTGRTCVHWPSLQCRVQAMVADRGYELTGQIGTWHVEHEPWCPTLLRARLNPAERGHADSWVAGRRKRRQAQSASRRRNRR